MSYKGQLEKELYSYRSMLAALENDGPEEIKAVKSKRVEAINRALASLTYTEKEIIEQKYFTPAQLSDRTLSWDMEIGLTTFYKYKEQALRKMANALNFI